MSMMVSFVLSFFPRDVLDEILNLIESVSEDFPSYSSMHEQLYLIRNYTKAFEEYLGFDLYRPILDVYMVSMSSRCFFFFFFFISDHKQTQLNQIKLELSENLTIPPQ